MPPGLTSHIPQITESASSNWFGACAGVSTNTTSASALEATAIASANPVASALEATVSVSPAVALPADATPLRVTGHTTGTGDSTGLILVSAFEIVAVPWDYNVSFSLTDFPLVYPLMLHVHSVNEFVPPTLGLFMSHSFSHMHLCLLFTLHNCRQPAFVSCTKVATMTHVHVRTFAALFCLTCIICCLACKPFQGLVQTAFKDSWRLLSAHGCMASMPCCHAYVAWCT